MFLDELRDITENKITIEKNEKFAAIIGLNPSNGARSPKLWNAVLSKFEPSLKMIALDVQKKNIIKLLEFLQSNTNYLGGAVAAPYKEVAYDFLKNNVDAEVGLIKAVNNISRGKNGKLYGHNTDGEASLAAFKENYKSIKDKNILIMGYGGVGKAVTAYFMKELSSSAKINILTTKQNIEKVIFNNKSITFKKWNSIDDLIKDTDILINCTDIGWNDKIDRCPIEANVLKSLKKESIVYDIIYDPVETELIRLSKKFGLENMNGEKMNIYQAVFAFQNTIKTLNESLNINDIKKIMLGALPK